MMHERPLAARRRASHSAAEIAPMQHVSSLSKDGATVRVVLVAEQDAVAACSRVTDRQSSIGAAAAVQQRRGVSEWRGEW
jgi:hypothetical protein